MIKNTLITFIFGSIVCLELSAETITIGNDNWKPYQGEDFKHGGILPHIVTQAFALEAIDVDNRWVPWKRVMTYVESGRWDVVNSVIKSQERDRFLLYSDSIMTYEPYLFHLKSNPLAFNKMSDLSGKIVGTKRGYYYGERFKDAVTTRQISLEEETHHKQNFKKLLAGRIHLVIIDKEAAFNLLQKQFTKSELNAITFHPVPVQRLDIHLGISKSIESGQQLVKSFNRGLKVLKQSGKLEQMWHDFENGAYQSEVYEPET